MCSMTQHETDPIDVDTKFILKFSHEQKNQQEADTKFINICMDVYRFCQVLQSKSKY